MEVGDEVLRWGVARNLQAIPSVRGQAGGRGRKRAQLTLAAAQEVQEDAPVEILVRRGLREMLLELTVTPRSGWGGRGILGAQLLPPPAAAD